MLLGQFIVVLMSAAKRFDTVLLHALDSARSVLSRLGVGGSDLQEG
jgi:hypothetical protein